MDKYIIKVFVIKKIINLKSLLNNNMITSKSVIEIQSIKADNLVEDLNNSDNIEDDVVVISDEELEPEVVPIKSRSRRFKCKRCNKVFRHIGKLITHRKKEFNTHHRYKITPFNKQKFTSTSLAKHRSFRGPFKCSYCRKIFKHPGVFIHHFKKSRYFDSFPCDECIKFRKSLRKRSIIKTSKPRELYETSDSSQDDSIDINPLFDLLSNPHLIRTYKCYSCKKWNTYSGTGKPIRCRNCESLISVSIT